jgi:methyl-accepting chemotaxis protein
MEDKALIDKIKGLKKIQPAEQWVVFCRSELKKEMEIANVSVWQYLFNRPALVGITTFILALGGGLTVINAAWGSLPGDKLYPVKLALEKTELRITTDGTAKTKLQAEITGRRAQELTEVTKLPPSLREQKIAEAVAQIEEQLTATQENLPELREKIRSGQNNDSREIAEAAKIFQENNGRLREAIKEAGKNVSEISDNKSLSDKISDISEKLNVSQNEISEIIESISNLQGEVKNNNEGNNSPTSTSILAPEK